MAVVFIGLGTNLGDRGANIERAKKMLGRIPGLAVVRESSLEETRPVDVTDQPDFLNQVVMVETDMAPLELLRHLRMIESAMGRVRTVPKGPRVIDLDILLYGDVMMKTSDLTIPHPRIKEREFVLRHLLEIDPELADPQTKQPYREVLLGWQR